MVKVVGYDDALKKRATCRHCSAINEYLPKDVKNLWRGTDYGGGSDGADGFKCAECGKDIHVRSW